MKKLILLLHVLFLTACKSENDQIPLIIYDMDDPYMNQFAEDIVALNDSRFTYVVHDSQNSQLIQNEIIESALELNPKVLVINPVERLSAYTIIQKIEENNVPIIFFNREPLAEDMELSDSVYYVGAPAENSAKIQADIVHDAFGNPNSMSDYDKNGDGIIQLIILKGEQGHQDAETRTRVIVEELEKRGYTLEILAIPIADWNTTKAYEKMIELLKQDKDRLELIISNNDAMAIGAISALSETKAFTDINENGVFDPEEDIFIPVIGIDGIQQAITLIEQGYLYGTVLNDSEEMAKAIGALAKALAENEDIYDIGYDIVDGKYIWVDYKKYVPNEE